MGLKVRHPGQAPSVIVPKIIMPDEYAEKKWAEIPRVYEDLLLPEIPPMDLVMPGLEAGSIGIIGSPGGTGKTWLILYLMCLIAIFGNACGGTFAPGAVLYSNAEDGMRAMMRRLQAIAALYSREWGEAIKKMGDFQLTGHSAPSAKYPDLPVKLLNANLNIMDNRGENIDLMETQWRDRFLFWGEKAAKKSIGGRLRAIILDTYTKHHHGDENSNSDMGISQGNEDYIAKELNCVVIVLHHTSKAAALEGRADTIEAFRGSSALVWNRRYAATLTSMTPDEADGFYDVSNCNELPTEAATIQEHERRRYKKFKVVKANEGMEPDDQWFYQTQGGALRNVELQFSQELYDSRQKRRQKRQTRSVQRENERAAEQEAKKAGNGYSGQKGGKSIAI